MVSLGSFSVNLSRKTNFTIPRLPPKATEPTYELIDCENNFSQSGIDTLGLLLTTKCDPELTCATHN